MNLPCSWGVGHGPCQQKQQSFSELLSQASEKEKRSIITPSTTTSAYSLFGEKKEKEM